jgi:hypothetical protein
MGSIANCCKETDTLDPVTYFWFLYFAQNVKYIINYFWLQSVLTPLLFY